MRHLLLIACLLVGRVASAGEATGVVVTGDETLKPTLAAELERWLRTHDADVVASPLPADAIGALGDCFARGDEACARHVIDTRASSPVVIYVRVEVPTASDGSHAASLTAYRFTKGGDPTVERRFCERCTTEALATTATDLMNALASAAQPAAGTLRLDSVPAGAQVMIGGRAIGVTPLVHELAPGEQVVTLVLDGHELESRTVVVRAGEISTVEVPLVPVARERPRRVLPAVLTIGGTVALAAGITLVAIDEDPSPTGEPTIRDTAPAGVVLASAGGLAAVVGLWLWLRSGHGSSAPVASASRDSAYVGWSTRF
jgi:hypothetical protein